MAEWISGRDAYRPILSATASHAAASHAAEESATNGACGGTLARISRDGADNRALGGATSRVA